MSDSRVSGQVATVSVKSLQSVGCCQGPGPEAEQDYTPDCHLISSGCGPVLHNIDIDVKRCWVNNDDP